MPIVATILIATLLTTNPFSAPGQDANNLIETRKLMGIVKISRSNEFPTMKIGDIREFVVEPINQNSAESALRRTKFRLPDSEEVIQLDLEAIGTSFSEIDELSTAVIAKSEKGFFGLAHCTIRQNPLLQAAGKLAKDVRSAAASPPKKRKDYPMQRKILVSMNDFRGIFTSKQVPALLSNPSNAERREFRTFVDFKKDGKVIAERAGSSFLPKNTRYAVNLPERRITLTWREANGERNLSTWTFYESNGFLHVPIGNNYIVSKKLSKPKTILVEHDFVRRYIAQIMEEFSLSSTAAKRLAKDIIELSIARNLDARMELALIATLRSRGLPDEKKIEEDLFWLSFLSGNPFHDVSDSFNMFSEAVLHQAGAENAPKEKQSELIHTFWNKYRSYSGLS